MLKAIIYCLFYSMLATALLSINVIPAFASADVSAEALWIDSNDKIKAIKLAQLIDDEWQGESVIYQTDNPMTSLAFGTAPEGEKLMVWTEQKRQKTELMFMTASVVDGMLRWTQASKFTNKGHENFSASIVYDASGVAWVFWASTREDFSDVVLRKFDGSWGEIEQVHASNAVPDIKPRTSISESGDVLVEWESYDYQAGSYVRRSRQYKSIRNSDDQLAKILIDKVHSSDVQLPSDMYTGAQALLHFPTNQMIQSVLYRQGSASN